MDEKTMDAYNGILEELADARKQIEGKKHNGHTYISAETADTEICLASDKITIYSNGCMAIYDYKDGNAKQRNNVLDDCIVQNCVKDWEILRLQLEVYLMQCN